MIGPLDQSRPIAHIMHQCITTGVAIEIADSDNGEVRKEEIHGDMVVVTTGHSKRNSSFSSHNEDESKWF